MTMIYDGVITKPSMDELYHHGIKGQKWGVKNGPPYPLSSSFLEKGRKQTKYGFKGRGGNARKVTYKPGETTDKHYIKKGTKMYRVSSVDNENHIGETYVTYNPVDRAFYRAYIKSMNNGARVYETTFKATQDLVVPSQKELAEVQKKVIWDNPKLKKQSIEGFSNFRAYGDYKKESIDARKKNFDTVNQKVKLKDVVGFKGVSSDGTISVILKNGKNKDIKGVDEGKFWDAYGYQVQTENKERILKQIKNQEISQFSVISLSMGTSKELKQAMIKELRSRGYNSMVDEAGIGALEVPGINDKVTGKVSREGVEPIIVFDRSESLKAIKTKKVENADYDYQYYEQWRRHKDNAYRNITW